MILSAVDLYSVLEYFLGLEQAELGNLFGKGEK